MKILHVFLRFDLIYHNFDINATAQVLMKKYEGFPPHMPIVA